MPQVEPKISEWAVGGIEMADCNVRIAVLIPCDNEEATIVKVVRDFRAVLPDANVYDNNSDDRTCEEARSAVAEVRTETHQSKGNVLRRMFADIEADLYLMVDGDDTYDAAVAPTLVERLRAQRLDTVNAARVTDERDAFRSGHRWGNRVLTGLVQRMFGDDIADMLSGYRVLSRRFAKSFPALSRGFEIETELTVHALALRMPVDEIEAPYGARPVDSISKLNTVRDGFRILRTILALVKDERPLLFFGLVFALLATSSVLLAVPVILEFIETGLVPRFPTAILSTGMMLLAFLALASGLILDNVATARKEMRRLHYLNYSAPGEASPRTDA